jgi:sugar phosphate isomerase/epimerase
MDYEITLCDGGACPRRTYCYRAQVPLVSHVDIFGSPPFWSDGSCDHFWPYLRLRIGMQASVADTRVLDVFYRAAARGMDAFEFCCDDCVSAKAEGNYLAASAWSDIRAKAQAADVELSVRIALDDMVMPGYIDRRCDYAIQLVQAVGATLLIVPLDLRHGITNFVQHLSPLLQEVTHFSCRVALENMPGDTPEAINALFATFWHDFPEWWRHVGFCFDMGHANLCNDTRNNYHAFFDRLGGDIPLLHLHLFENWGDEDSHLPLFSGSNGQYSEGLKGIIYRLGKHPFEGAAMLASRLEDMVLAASARIQLMQMLSYNEHMWTTASELRQGKG